MSIARTLSSPPRLTVMPTHGGVQLIGVLFQAPFEIPIFSGEKFMAIQMVHQLLVDNGLHHL